MGCVLHPEDKTHPLGAAVAGPQEFTAQQKNAGRQGQWHRIRDTAYLDCAIGGNLKWNLYCTHSADADRSDMLGDVDFYRVTPSLNYGAERHAAGSPRKALCDMPIGPIVERLLERTREDRNLTVGNFHIDSG